MDVEAPSPDPAVGEAAKQNAEIGREALQLSREQWNAQQDLLKEYSPLFKDLIGKSTAAQDAATQQSQDQWESYRTNFAPIEQKLAKNALEYDTPERRAAAAAEASGTVADQFAAARDQRNSDMASAGLIPGSGATLAMDNASRIEEARAKAGAATDARKNVESMGLAYLDNAARFGRNMPSTGIQTAALSQQAGSQAQGSVGGLSSLTAAPGAAATPLLGTAAGANSSAGSLLLGQYSAQQSAANQKAGIFGDVLGAGLGAAGMYFSSAELKDVGEEVDGLAAAEKVERSPSKAWRYRPGLGDGSTKQRIGPLAESLASVAPEVSDGTQVDGIALMGLHHAAIGDASKRLKRIEAKLGLEAARRD